MLLRVLLRLLGGGASSIGPDRSSKYSPTPASSPLTAEQEAEKKKEAERIVAQLAKPSGWDQEGCGLPNASALKAALADTVLVGAAWLVRLAEAGGIIPRCQDLPPGARVTLEEMEKWTHDLTMAVLVVSCPWWAPLGP